MSKCEQTTPYLLSVILDEVRDMREEVRRELAAMKLTMDVTVEMVQEFGLRLHGVERRASGTPPPGQRDAGNGGGGL